MASCKRLKNVTTDLFQWHGKGVGQSQPRLPNKADKIEFTLEYEVA
jgi:hypothetical protein